MRVRLFAAAAVAALIAAFQAPALASTGGTPDGETHPNVAMIFGYTAEGRFRCSATLVRDDLILTAAHCTDGMLGRMGVTFKSEIQPDPNATTSGLPVAADTSAGYTAAELEAAGYYSGVPHTHPQYSDFTDTRNWNDVGALVLDEPVTDIAPASVAGLNTLDGIKYANLSKTLFRAVGYGTEVRKAATGPQKPTAMSFPLIRRWVDMPGQKLTPQILQTQGNPNDPHGTGGTCFGDSGGPVFYQGKIVAVTSYGNNEVCRGIAGYQRVDIGPAQSWLASEFGFHA